MWNIFLSEQMNVQRRQNEKLFNICLIVFVLFSQFISFPYNQAKAETLKETSLFDTVEMKDATDHIIDEAKILTT